MPLQKFSQGHGSKIYALNFPAVNIVIDVKVGRQLYAVARLRHHIVVFLIVVESVKIEIRHQLGFHIAYRFGQCIQKLVEILFVKEHFVTIVTIIVEPLFAFRNGYEVIICTS